MGDCCLLLVFFDLRNRKGGPAEQDAADALDSVYVIYDAQLAVLDALDARAYADERAKIAAM